MFKCVECGRKERRPNDAEDRKFLEIVHKDTGFILDWEERGICLDCGFWTSIIEKDLPEKDRVLILEEGSLFTAQPDIPPEEVRKRGGLLVGHGGGAFLFRMKADGREILSHNIWHRGLVPTRFQDRLKPNAENLPYREIIRYKRDHGLLKPGQLKAMQEFSRELAGL